jgi:hypothetical protein
MRLVIRMLGVEDDYGSDDVDGIVMAFVRSGQERQ